MSVFHHPQSAYLSSRPRHLEKSPTWNAVPDNDILASQTGEMSDEPDDQSTQLFAPTASGKLSQLSKVVSSHINAYNNEENIPADYHIDDDLVHVKSVMSSFSDETRSISSHVGYLLDKLGNLNEVIAEKLKNDHHSAQSLIQQASQIRHSKDSAAEKANRLSALVGLSYKTSEAAQKNAKVAENVAGTFRMVSELLESIEDIRHVAEQAKVEADLALQQAEAERLADERRLQREEEAQKQAAKEARAKVEENRKREIERDRLASQLAMSVTEQDDSSPVSAVDIRKNPKYWPSFGYDKEANFFDQGIGVIVRAFPNDIEKSDISVDTLDQTSIGIELKEGEELLSNIVKISYTGEDFATQLSEPLSVVIPHCGYRLASFREAVVKYVGKSGKWRELTTSEVFLEEHRDVRFAECRIKPLGVFVVVSRIKHDSHMMVPSGCQLVSNVDSRVSIDILPGTVRIQSRLTLRLQPVDTTLFQDFKRQIPYEESEWLSSTSSFIYLSMLNRNLKHPLKIHMPAPPSITAKQRHLPVKKVDSNRINTAPVVSQSGKKEKKPQVSLEDAINAALAAGKAAEKAAQQAELPQVEDQMNKPLTGIMGKEREEEFILVAWEPDIGPIVIDGCEIEEGKRDDLSLILKMPYPKFILLRTMKSNNRQPAVIIKTIVKLEEFINKRHVTFAMRQQREDASACWFSMTPTKRIDQMNRQFTEEGFVVKAAAHSSNEAIIEEGQPIELCLTGNLSSSSDVFPNKFCFNSQFKNQLRFSVQPIDLFAQKSFDMFYGFLDVFTFVTVDRRVQDEETHRIRMEKTVERVKIAELLLEFPKNDSEHAIQPVTEVRSNAAIRSEGIIDEKLLRQIADEVGKDWRLLTKHLGIKKSRASAISEKFESRGPEACCFEALLTWFKQSAKNVNKVDSLTRALSVIGRPDLSENVTDLNRDFQRERSNETSSEKLRIAFMKIVQDEQVLRSWQHLARALNVSESASESIKRLNLSTRDKCMHILNEWKSQSNRSLVQLSGKLRHGNFTNAARLVKRIDAMGQ